MNQVYRQMYHITLNEKMWFKCNSPSAELSLKLGGRYSAFRSAGKPFRYPKINVVNHESESIQQVDSGNNCAADISECLHIGNAKEGYQSNNNVNHI